MTLPVTSLLKNSTKFVSIDSAFFSVFFAIRDLPYIAVLDENQPILWHPNSQPFAPNASSRMER